MPSGSHDINVKVLALLGVVSTVLVFALIVATQAWFRYEFAKEDERKYVNVPFRQLEELKRAQQDALHAPEHMVEVDGQQRLVIPIEDAMNLVVAEHGG